MYCMCHLVRILPIELIWKDENNTLGRGRGEYRECIQNRASSHWREKRKKSIGHLHRQSAEHTYILYKYEVYCTKCLEGEAMQLLQQPPLYFYVFSNTAFFFFFSLPFFISVFLFNCNKH